MSTSKRYLSTDSAARKRVPMASGLLDYFPDALAAVAEVSWIGNEKHNPGEPLHHARGKSMDHADCIVRHFVERGGFDVFDLGGVTYRVRHSAYLAWRALALLQEELETDLGLGLPRGATAPETDAERRERSWAEAAITDQAEAARDQAARTLVDRAAARQVLAQRRAEFDATLVRFDEPPARVEIVAAADLVR